MFQSPIRSAAILPPRDALALLDRTGIAPAIEVRALAAAEIDAALPVLGRLRAQMFREWPYLYDADPEFERHYLRAIGSTPGATLIVALDGEEIVGAASASPLLVQEDDLVTPFAAAGWDVGSIFYFGESLLLPPYRGRGVGHRFFDLRERQARLAGASHAVFASVERPPCHPGRPPQYAPLDPFWRRRGYRPLENPACTLMWKDTLATAEMPHRMRLWHRVLA